MRCEDVGPLLPELAEGEISPSGDVEAHLGTCAGCTADLGAYRRLLTSMSSLAETSLESPEGLLDRLLERTPAASRAARLRRMAADDRVQNAAFSLGGAVVGATAVGLLWWRARRGPSEAQAAR